MLIDLIIIASYFLFARWVILNIKKFGMREIAGPIISGIGLSFLGLGIVEDSFVSFITLFPACIYLVYISGKAPT